MSDGPVAVAHPLRVARAQHRLTQKQLATRSGVSTRTIHAIENPTPRYRPRRDVCRKIARALGVEDDWRELFPEWQHEDSEAG